MLEFIPNALRRVLLETPELDQSYLVGGCVRDALLKKSSKDFDVEVFGLNYETLTAVLSRWGRTDLVGRSFGVVKLTIPGSGTFDFAIPRRDSKVAPGHKGFEVEFDPRITPREAASRRDFTINALMYQPREGRLHDYFNGAMDLEQRILRHVSAAFTDDPLRVLRGMQLASRFNLRAAPETLELCRRMKSCYPELAMERVREEWFKWAGASTSPSAGLVFLKETEWIEHFPEIAALVGTPQDPEWHPEGDVFVHTCHSCDALAELEEWKSADRETRIVLMLAVLSHDFGKPTTTQKVIHDGRPRIISPGHEEEGRILTESFLERMQAPGSVQQRVPPLVANHLAHLANEITDRGVRRLARRLHPATIEDLCRVIIADHFGRPPEPKVVPENVQLLRNKAEALSLQASAPRPILMGRHLMECGLKPGPLYGQILDAAFEAQLEGEFTDLDGALAWLDKTSPMSDRQPKHTERETE